MASYHEGEGILALSDEWIPLNPREWWQQKKLRHVLWDHLNWSNKTPSPFISVSRDKEWALHQAARREEEGKTGVVVYEICITDEHLHEYHADPRNPRIRWKGVRRWLDLAESCIPKWADYPSTENELLFLHHIPDEFITRI